ncbi:unnamed protein product [Adineta steineri]|uniref:Uncharacterized protein n=1 Tax=Adineta steineri TaxID=433720 RepID=A0A813MHQ0_9BILA|nr:unnamed protein product [Adineta steineri]
MCISNVTYDKLFHISSSIWHVFGFIGVLFGIPGHILQIIISFNKTSRKDPTSLHFIAMSIVDIVFLLDIYRWITSQTLFSNSNYFCSGQPLHTYNYYFQEYDQCIGLYIQSNTSSCLRDSTCENVSPFICELCSYMI